MTARKLNLTESFEKLIEDIIQTHELFQHYQPERISVCFAKKKFVTYYYNQYVVKLEIESLIKSIPFIKDGVSVFYFLRIRFPSFWEGSFKQRLVNLFHELFHISPACDGSFKNLPSKVSIYHGNSHKIYNYFMEIFANQYLEKTTNPCVYEFMKYSLNELLAIHQSIRVRCVRRKRGKKEWRITTRELRELLY